MRCEGQAGRRTGVCTQELWPWGHKDLGRNGSSVPSWWCDLVQVTSVGPPFP